MAMLSLPSMWSERLHQRLFFLKKAKKYLWDGNQGLNTGLKELR